MHGSPSIEPVSGLMIIVLPSPTVVLISSENPLLAALEPGMVTTLSPGVVLLRMTWVSNLVSAMAIYLEIRSGIEILHVGGVVIITATASPAARHDIARAPLGAIPDERLPGDR